MKVKGREVIELLAENETKVGNLYEAIARSSRMDIGKEFFIELAKDEYRHHNQYMDMLKNAENVEALDMELSEEDSAYLRTIMENNVMAYEEDLIHKAETIWKTEDAYIIADKVERETILLVHEIIRLYPELSPDLMNKILKEEKKHLMKVAKAYQKYREQYLI